MLRKRKKILKGIWFSRVPYTCPPEQYVNWSYKNTVCGMYKCKFSDIDDTKKPCIKILVRGKYLGNLCSDATRYDDPKYSRYSYIPDQEMYILENDEIKKIS